MYVMAFCNQPEISSVQLGAYDRLYIPYQYWHFLSHPILYQITIYRLMTIEIIQFDLNGAISDYIFKEQSAAMQREVLKRLPGFRERHLGRCDDCGWLDLRYWNSLGSAQAARESLMQSEVARAWQRMVDRSSWKTRYIHV